MTRRIYVLRFEVDRLIADYPSWMASSWPLLSRRWDFGGCSVAGDERAMGTLSRMLVSIRSAG